VSRYLIDTNILVRIVSPRDPLKPVAAGAVDALRRLNESLCVAPQNLLEFWAVATRPREANGLGFTPEAAAQEVDCFAENFPLVVEPPAVYTRWRQVYDARIAAVMIENSVDYILTFNVDDFRRYPGITPVSPQTVAAPQAPAPRSG
jgi:predicted nucleic acid-binding protein